MKTDKVLHHVHHADPVAHQTQKRETVIKHQTSKSISSYQVTGLALELSRKADNTIDLSSFEINCDRAFEILTKIQARIDAQQPKLESETNGLAIE